MDAVARVPQVPSILSRRRKFHSTVDGAIVMPVTERAEIRAPNCAPDNGYFVSPKGGECSRGTRNIRRIIGLRSRKAVKDLVSPEGLRPWK